MQFQYVQSAELPSLAWCARVTRNSDDVVVLHGSGVETAPHAFVEGAWDGNFTSLDFIDATIVCGTGGRADDGHVRFSGSTDRLCPLFSIVKGDSVFISQSPAFVMVAAGEAPHDLYPFYAHDFIRIFRQGLYCQDGTLRLASQTFLHVHFSTIVTIDRQLRTTFKSHRLCERPRDFESYKALLKDGVRRVLENASDPARRRWYVPLAALSKGYDSSATAALAGMAGCRETLSSCDSRRDVPGEDSGADNSAYLGMSCLEYDRWRYLDLDPGIEAEFGYFTLSSIVPLAVLEHALAGRILVVGASGDAVWSKEYAHIFDDLTRPFAKYISGIGQLEFRLRIGYQLLPATLIGARHNRAIGNISASDEMRPWSVGGRYDRPTPRRIAEEAGLPREGFGIRKAGGGHSHLNAPEQFSKASLDDYRRFVRERHRGARWHRRSYWRVRDVWRRCLLAVFGRKRLVASSPLQRRFPFILNARPIGIPFEFMFVFQWASARMRSRYASAVNVLGRGLSAESNAGGR